METHWHSGAVVSAVASTDSRVRVLFCVEFACSPSVCVGSPPAAPNRISSRKWVDVWNHYDYTWELKC